MNRQEPVSNAMDDFMGELNEFHCAMVKKHKCDLIDELLASGLITNFDDKEYQEYLNG